MAYFNNIAFFFISEKVPCCCSQRWILAYTAFFGFLMVYALRVNISVGIVCMVRTEVTNNTVAHNQQNASYAEETCILETSKLTNDVSKYYHFRSLFLNISNVVCFMVSKKTLCHSICLQQLQLISKIHSVRILLSITCEYEKSIEILFAVPILNYNTWNL